MLVSWFSNRVLKRLENLHVQRSDIDLKGARRLAVLFEATDPASIRLVKSLVRMFVHAKYDVYALGFVNEPNKSLEHLSTLNFDYFSNAQLNWYGKPKGMIIDNYLEENYDVLIDLSLKSHYPLTYLTLASSAVFKLGRFRKDICIFDHEIKMRDFQSLDSLIKEVTHCLIPTEGHENRYRKNRSCVDNSLQGG